MVQRVLLGAFQGTYVLRVSREGFDVTNTTLNANQLVFDSRYTETMEILASGTVQSGPFNSTQKVTVNFPNQVTPPAVIAMCKLFNPPSSGNLSGFGWSPLGKPFRNNSYSSGYAETAIFNNRVEFNMQSNDNTSNGRYWLIRYVIMYNKFI